MAPPPVDETHWLLRLAPEQWLNAARNELSQSEQALERGQSNKGMVLARRAAGMAMNARLVLQANEAWQRSYMEHLQAAARGDDVPPEVSAAAAELAERDAQPLMRLGGGVSAGPARAALVIVEWCAAEVDRLLR
jgi:HEPN domain-containing protein